MIRRTAVALSVGVTVLVITGTGTCVAFKQVSSPRFPTSSSQHSDSPRPRPSSPYSGAPSPTPLPPHDNSPLPGTPAPIWQLNVSAPALPISTLACDQWLDGHGTQCSDGIQE
jgi:hypothetical protein